jgi:hypothetical protein
VVLQVADLVPDAAIRSGVMLNVEMKRSGEDYFEYF